MLIGKCLKCINLIEPLKGKGFIYCIKKDVVVDVNKLRICRWMK